eukprot:scaffold5293_cov114-Isochrysis_galbana.AAC.2
MFYPPCGGCCARYDVECRPRKESIGQVRLRPPPDTQNRHPAGGKAAGDEHSSRPCAVRRHGRNKRRVFAPVSY